MIYGLHTTARYIVWVVIEIAVNRFSQQTLFFFKLRRSMKLHVTQPVLYIYAEGRLQAVHRNRFYPTDRSNLSMVRVNFMCCLTATSSDSYVITRTS
jgi:hypothetical protein